jgi:hypothetical protein
MTSTFVDAFVSDEHLSDVEHDVLAAVDVRTLEDVDSLVKAFPSISALGVRLPTISSFLLLGSAATVIES